MSISKMEMGAFFPRFLISILLLVNDVIILASSIEGLQRQLNTLALFYGLQ